MDLLEKKVRIWVLFLKFETDQDHCMDTKISTPNLPIYFLVSLFFQKKLYLLNYASNALIKVHRYTNNKYCNSLHQGAVFMTVCMFVC